MPANQLVQARIDGAVKEEATAVLAAMGLTVSDAVRLLLTRVAREKALPFAPLVPNAVTSGSRCGVGRRCRYRLAGASYRSIAAKLTEDRAANTYADANGISDVKVVQPGERVRQEVGVPGR